MKNRFLPAFAVRMGAAIFLLAAALYAPSALAQEREKGFYVVGEVGMTNLSDYCKAAREVVTGRIEDEVKAAAVALLPPALQNAEFTASVKQMHRQGNQFWRGWRLSNQPAFRG